MRPEPETGGASARDAPDPIGRELRGLTRAMSELAEAFAERRKQGVGDAVSDMARGVRQGGEAMEGYPNVQAVALAVAERLEEAARDVRARDLRAMAADARRFAQRHPMALGATAALMGLVAARLLRSAMDEAAKDEAAKDEAAKDEADRDGGQEGATSP